MRFWAYFAAKILVAGVVLWGLLGVIDSLFPHIDTTADLAAIHSATHSSPVNPVAPGYRVARIEPAPRIEENETDPTPAPNAPARKSDLAIDSRLIPLRNTGEVLAMNTTLMAWFLLCAGALYLIVRDQRYRCRVCLRRLRMPVLTGSRGFMLQLGRPRTEYICPYGHGTLKEEETATSVLDGPVWTRHSDDIWAELVAAGKEDDDRR